MNSCVTQAPKEMTFKHFKVIIPCIPRLEGYIKVLLIHKSAVLSGIRLDILTAVKIHILIFLVMCICCTGICGFHC